MTSRGSTGRGWQNCFISLLTTTPSWLGEFGLKPVFSIGSVVDLYSNIDRELILSKREDLEGTKGLDENALYHLRDALTKIREYHETEDEQRSSIDGSFRKKNESVLSSDCSQMYRRQ
ncbi:type IV secretory system conjugative DNA transfer family protein [Escherichia coli]